MTATLAANVSTTMTATLAAIVTTTMAANVTTVANVAVTHPIAVASFETAAAITVSTEATAIGYGYGQ